MPRKLAATVTLTAENGETATYPAGSVPPADVAKQITNPSAWEPEVVTDALGDAEAGSGGPTDGSAEEPARAGKPARIVK